MLDTNEGVLVLDVETSSGVDIKVGSWPYSEHESTLVLCLWFCYATKSGRRTWFPWEPGDQLPLELRDFIRCGGLIVAHNTGFERAIWENILRPKFAFPGVDIDQWRDTQALGLALNLPAFGLDALGKSLGLKIKKDKVGAALMKEMACALLIDGEWLYPKSECPKSRRRLSKYCRRDVAVTADAYFKLLPLTVTEQIIWLTDQRINARGVPLDVRFAKKCARMAERRKETLAIQAFCDSEGDLPNATGTPKLKKWLKEQGVKLPKIKRKRENGDIVATETANRPTCEKLILDSATPAHVRVVLENRLEANKATSLAKLDQVPNIVGRDGRLRNALQYCGAHTGRWTSYGLQLHNLPKNKLTEEATKLAFLCCDAEDLDLLQIAEERPLEAMSSLLRSMICASPGHELIAADYSAIEARVIAWLADQEDILEQFREGADVYVYSADGIGALTCSHSWRKGCVACEKARQLGKVGVLALGYGMGDYRVYETTADWGVPLDLKASREFKKAWRETNAMIVHFWKDLEDAVRAVILNPKKAVRVGTRGCLRVSMGRNCLKIRLPSGRSLRYWRPRIRKVKKEWTLVDDDGVVYKKRSSVEEIQFFSVSKSKKGMSLESTYSGKLAENVTQAIARDLLGEALPRIEKVEPYELVMHVHDSAAAEVPAGEGDVAEFEALMGHRPRWAAGLPLAVEGYRDVRFRG